ncbi:hypothetical protein [Bacillus wiedmannii]|nr:hypothetical protein [Bacillus wiedmannii]
MFYFPSCKSRNPIRENVGVFSIVNGLILENFHP